MISYHFLDSDMDVFSEATKSLSTFRAEVFKNRVAFKLADNCQEKITA